MWCFHPCRQYISNTKLDRLLHEWAGTEGLDESWYTKKGLSEGPKKLKVCQSGCWSCIRLGFALGEVECGVGSRGRKSA